MEEKNEIINMFKNIFHGIKSHFFIYYLNVMYHNSIININE